MKIDAISEKVTGLPFMTPVQARAITELMMKHNARDILELGF